MADNQNRPSGGANIVKYTAEDLRIAEELREMNKGINSDFNGFIKNKKKLRGIQTELNELEDAYAKAAEAIGDENNEDLKKYRQELDIKKKLLVAQNTALNSVSRMAILYRTLEATSVGFMAGATAGIIGFISQADKAFKMANLQLGLSGERSESFLDTLINTSEYAASMGVGFAELTKIQTEFANQTGRGVLLSENSLENIVDITKGLGIGADEATKMVAQFDNMGVSVSRVKTFYEDAVNSSVKFGVNASRVVQLINTNLEKSQGFVFKGGIKGLAKMAEYSAKFKVEMDSVFSAMDKANSIEGAIDMASQLQVLGGEFARQDPFKLLNEARTDAVAFTKTMQGLTKGMANYNKSTGEFEVQAGDLNRLKLAADATEMSYQDLIKQAKEGAKMDTIMAQLNGTGISKEAKEFIQGVAEMKEDGSFKVKIAPGEFKDIRDISQSQVKALMGSNQTLDKRAKDAQTFDEVLINTVNELKSMLLPVLNVVQSVTSMMQEHKSLVKGVVGFASVVMAGVAAFSGLKSIINMGSDILTLFSGGVFKGIKEYLRPSIAGTVGQGSQTGGALAGANPSNARNITQIGQAAGSAAKGMLAFGAAVVMVGGGIWLATKGISTMIDSFNQLTDEQAIQVTETVKALGWTLVGLGTGMVIVGALGSTAAIGVLAFGAGVALIGAGIGVAAAGIGYMISSFSDLTKSLSNAGSPATMDGIGNLMNTIKGFSDPVATKGLYQLETAIDSISTRLAHSKLDSIGNGAQGFNHIADAIERLNEKKLDKLIKLSETLSGMSSIANALSGLNKVLGDSIEVKFKDDSVNLNVNITAEIDSQKVSSIVSRHMPLQLERVRKGSTGS